MMIVLDDVDLTHMLNLRATAQITEITKYLDDKIRTILFKT